MQPRPVVFLELHFIFCFWLCFAFSFPALPCTLQLLLCCVCLKQAWAFAWLPFLGLKSLSLWLPVQQYHLLVFHFGGGIRGLFQIPPVFSRSNWWKIERHPLPTTPTPCRGVSWLALFSGGSANREWGLLRLGWLYLEVCYIPQSSWSHSRSLPMTCHFH